MPWTSDAAGKMNNKIAAPKDIKDSKPAVAAKKLSEDEMKKLKSTLFKPIVTKKEEEAAAKTVAAAPVEAKKKGFFGLF